jgi:hypothetical protein
VLASHYAEPVERRVGHQAPLRSDPSDEGKIIRSVASGEPFLMLDNSLGWAWGYAGSERRVGYLRSDALAG